MEKTIFIIEDDVNMLSSLEAKFKVEDFAIITKLIKGDSTVKEIVDQVKKGKPAYIILDLLLPNVDGFDVITELVSDEVTNKIPIIVFTNLTDEDSKRKGLKLGATHYFIKSEFNIDNFVAKVRKIIANREKIK